MYIDHKIASYQHSLDSSFISCKKTMP